MTPAAQIVLVRAGADASRVARALTALGLWTTRVSRGDQVAFVVRPPSPFVETAALLEVEGVSDVLSSSSEHPLVDAHPAVVVAGGRRIGHEEPAVLMAGPCSVESREQMLEIAEAVAAAGGAFLRGSAFKPRTSPYSFQGSGPEGLRWLREAADRYGLAVVTEAVAEDHVAPVAEVTDLLQVGSRNMHSPGLLQRVGAAGKPVLLKRGMAATVEEWLLAAETCLLHGAPAVVLCERGVRGASDVARNLLDIAAVALIRREYGLPVVVDPSHAAGRRDLVVPLGRAALAAGASGLLVEVHPAPGLARSDGPQALLPGDLAALMPMEQTNSDGETRAHGSRRETVHPGSRL